MYSLVPRIMPLPTTSPTASVTSATGDGMLMMSPTPYCEIFFSRARNGTDAKTKREKAERPMARRYASDGDTARTGVQNFALKALRHKYDGLQRIPWKESDTERFRCQLKAPSDAPYWRMLRSQTKGCKRIGKFFWFGSLALSFDRGVISFPLSFVVRPLDRKRVAVAGLCGSLACPMYALSPMFAV